jgi:hypothetical protein
MLETIRRHERVLSCVDSAFCARLMDQNYASDVPVSWKFDGRIIRLGGSGCDEVPPELHCGGDFIGGDDDRMRWSQRRPNGKKKDPLFPSLSEEDRRDVGDAMGDKSSKPHCKALI